MAEESQLASAAMCRLCLEEQNPEESTGDELIAPCMCAGTQQFVHRSCLDKWRLLKEGDAFTHCTTCRAQYHLCIISGDWHKVKSCIFKAVDILIVLVPIHLMIFMLGGFACLFDLENFTKSHNHTWLHIFSNHAIVFYYCIGVLLLAIIAMVVTLLSLLYLALPANEGEWFQKFLKACCYIIVSMFVGFILTLVLIIYLRKIWRSYYGAKLTKEYIVEDLHGNYTPSMLDEKHAAHLRDLNLMPRD